MLRFISLMLVGMILTGCAGMEPKELAKDSDKPIVDVVKVPGKTKAELTDATRKWLYEKERVKKQKDDDFTTGFSFGHVSEGRESTGEVASAIVAANGWSQYAGGFEGTANLRMGCSGRVDCVPENRRKFSFAFQVDVKGGAVRVTYLDIREFAYVFEIGNIRKEWQLIRHQAVLDEVALNLHGLSEELRQHLTNVEKEAW